MSLPLGMVVVLFIMLADSLLLPSSLSARRGTEEMTVCCVELPCMPPKTTAECESWLSQGENVAPGETLPQAKRHGEGQG